jgi:succinyl-diaminopimelate desuccinylase
VIEFGPLNDTIHKVNERVSVADLNMLTDIYYHILVNLLTKAA